MTSTDRTRHGRTSGPDAPVVPPLVPAASTEESVDERPASRPQPHGGALLAGGVPGHRGGTGRPPSVLRAIARDGLADALPRLRLVAAGEPITVTRMVKGKPVDLQVRPSVGESHEAVDRLERLGLGTELRSEDIRARFERQHEILASALAAQGLTPDAVATVLDQIAQAWL